MGNARHEPCSRAPAPTHRDSLPHSCLFHQHHTARGDAGGDFPGLYLLIGHWSPLCSRDDRRVAFLISLILLRHSNSPA